MSRTNTPDLETHNPDGSNHPRVIPPEAGPCNACGNVLGDATDLEVTVQGVRLPDVRDECGCEARP